ncbi:MAG TPA: adenosine deaminase [Acidimicrobiales bacterium]|nr:adenosine deaminase [Acidimicrobiales bacterium]
MAESLHIAEFAEPVEAVLTPPVGGLLAIQDAAPSLEQVRRAPKVLLHDHLDGGLRPTTVVELAAAVGYKGLPTADPEELARWFVTETPRRNLVRYLEGFTHTVSVMQTKEALERVARECAEDLAEDGVIYAEVRFAPELHTEAGLHLEPVVEAVLTGFAAGMDQARANGRPIVVRALLTAMRTAARSLEIAELAVRYRDTGVAGFDVAGPEAGYPPTLHLEAFTLVQRENFHATVHAGEAFGLPSIWQALQWCGAERLGHGVRIVDDITVHEDGRVALGRLASYIRDLRVPLELCPTSNVHTGAVGSLAEHPIGLLRRLGFRATINTDNRLMSGVTLSSEMARCAEVFGWGWADLRWLSINAMKSAFYDFDERLALINGVIKPGYDALAAEAAFRVSSSNRRDG